MKQIQCPNCLGYRVGFRYSAASWWLDMALLFSIVGIPLFILRQVLIMKNSNREYECSICGYQFEIR